MERQTGSARLGGAQPGQGAEDELMRAVKEAAAAEYEILGEMGRGDRGSVMYLARERASHNLVILKLRPDAGSYELSVARDIDASLADVPRTCPFCNEEIVGAGRFCSHCGKDVSDARTSEASREEALAAVQRAAEGTYDVLGEMERSAGGGVGVLRARARKRAHRRAAPHTRDAERWHRLATS